MPPFPTDNDVDEDQSINQSVSQSNNESVNQSINQSINIHSIDRSTDALSALSDEPASHIALTNLSSNSSINQSVNQSDQSSVNQPINQSVNQSNQSSDQSVQLADEKEELNQSINKSTSQSINQSINQLTDSLEPGEPASINQSINQSVSQSTNQSTENPPFPYLLVLLLCSLNLNEAFQQNVLWPFVPELVRLYNSGGINGGTNGGTNGGNNGGNNGGTNDGTNDSNSFWAGMLAASYFFAQLLSSMPWGILSDKIGRRPVLIFGCLGATVSTFAFGMSTTYWTAVGSRFMSGLLSGVLGTSKTYTSEELPKCHAAKGLSAIGFSGGLGGIVGPIVGGYLAFPAHLYPGTFSEGSLFDQYPVLLPELVSVVVGCVGVALSLKFLPESKAFLRDQHARKVQEAKDKQINQSINQSNLLRQPLMNDVEMSIVTSDQSIVNHPDPASTNQSVNQSAPSSGSRLSAMFSVCKRRQVLITTTCYGLLALSFIIFDEMFSFFLEAPIAESGLGFSASQTGTFLSVTGGSLIAFQALIFPIMVDKLGVMETWWLWMKISVPYFMLFPFLSNLQTMLDDSQSWILYITIGFCCLIRAGVGASVFTPLFILIGGSCPSSMLGAANGLGQTFAAAARSIGPVIGGGIWSLSLSWGSQHHFAVYIVVVLITCVIMWVGSKLSTYLSWEDDPEQRKEFGLPPLDVVSTVRNVKDAVIHME